jgi:hypothetical protein
VLFVGTSVLDSVTSTPQWIRQPKPHGCVHDVCVCLYVTVCSDVLGFSGPESPPAFAIH